jgi:RES domain-containing protein
MLVHFDHEDAPPDYVSIWCDIPDDVLIETVDITSLPKKWRAHPPPEELPIIGTTWTERGSSAVLRVPSAVVPEDVNYLINPAHPEFGRCRVGSPLPFVFDGRLLR